MKCWNCGKELPEDAKVCLACEAAVQPDQAEMEKATMEALEILPPDAREQLFEMARQTDSAEEFVRQIFVGDCPKCSSEHTGDCMDDPELENPCIGRCYDCGYMWCTECGKTLDPKKPECPCWDEPIEGLEDLDGADENEAGGGHTAHGGQGGKRKKKKKKRK